MTAVKEGDKVRILCEIKLEDGALCYKNDVENPIEFTIGEGKFFPKIESKLINMQEGESKTLTLEPDEAFGQRIDDLIIDAHKDSLQTEVELDVGSKIKINTPSGKNYYAVVSEVNEDAFKLDLNHPLAGKKIIINLSIDAIVEDKPENKKKPLFKLKKKIKPPKQPKKNTKKTLINPSNSK